jgi:cytochrome oxidase Cu insertion factor (SCO1/SenC/PrrC family)
MSSIQRISIVILGCVIAGISGVTLARLLFRPRPAPDQVRVTQSTDDAAVGALPVLFPAPSFSLVDQSGKVVGDETLKSKPWIANFIFTHCAGPCPLMTAKMAQLQEKLAGDEVKLVSFSVDPERDRPEVLKSYADGFEADPTRWFFLTTADGSAQPIYAVAAALKLTAIGATENDPIIHSEKFLLMDGHGSVRGVYSSADDDSMNRLVADARRLAKGKGS